MCGIVGLFLKDKSLEPRLGEMLTAMLVTMTDRGPDSAGIAIYGAETKGRAKMTVQSDDPQTAFSGLDKTLSEAAGDTVTMAIKSTHAILDMPAGATAKMRQNRHLRRTKAVLIQQFGQFMRAMPVFCQNQNPCPPV